VLSGKDRHELACSSCGAPLHDLKVLPKSKRGDRELVRPSKLRAQQTSKSKKKKSKRRKSRWSTIFEDAFDIVEDIFD